MKTKKILVLGASGRVGKLVVENALAEGHEVTAFVHRSNPFKDRPRLSVIRGNIYTPADLEPVIIDADVIISTLGSWGTPRKDVLSVAMRNVIPLMKKHGVDRIISLTGSEARARGDKLGIVHKWAYTLLGVIAEKVLADGEKHIKLLEDSQLDWVVVRSPIMTNGSKRSYDLSDTRPLPWARVSRVAVVSALLHEAVSAELSQQAPFIH